MERKTLCEKEQQQLQLKKEGERGTGDRQGAVAVSGSVRGVKKVMPQTKDQNLFAARFPLRFFALFPHFPLSFSPYLSFSISV